MRQCLFFASIMTLAMARCAIGAETAATDDAGIDFRRDIRPILSDNCFQCHGPDSETREADLRLDVRDVALEAGAIVPGDAESSEVVARVFADDEDLRMPPAASNKSLTEAQKQLLREWIEQGAEYQTHWSFVPLPDHVDVPGVEDATGWIRTPLDAIVLDRLTERGYAPAEPASREKWIRRVTFDLTGLPPTLTEIDAFLADDSPDAFERVVDRLLASAAYGERMAVDWLDAARYADTFGYQADRDMHVWPWRDWVIRALNRNLPYDDFLIWQMAGDLLDDATDEQRIATAFNRLHRQTNEGGSTAEEFRVEYVSDRVHTMGTAILGLTLECARCHDHKYDPVTQRDYYALSAFLANIDEHGLYSHFTETAPTPALPLYKDDQRTRHEEQLARIRAAEAELAAIVEAARDRFAAWRSSSGETIQLPAPTHSFDFEAAEVSGANQLVEGKTGQAIQFSGDDQFQCGDAGQFNRVTPFSFALWVKPAEHKPRSILLHYSRAAEDSAFRGYSLVLDDGYPTFSLIHFWPGNAIRVRATERVPLDEWSHLAVTCDGSSRADGLRIYVDGLPVQCDVVRDKLTRDITHRKDWGDSDAGGIKLALGARFRDVGFACGVMDELEIYDTELSPLEIAVVAGSEVAPDEPSLFRHYLLRHDQPYRAARERLQQLRAEENEAFAAVRQLMVMREMNRPGFAFVLRRGDYTDRGQRVGPDTPASVFEFPDEYPRNRLGLAMWLVDERNPLTARVAVNRFWRVFFGRGLVGTPEDFGSQGEMPSHPALLDWLARWFIDSGWDVKALCRMIALSATYRQSSVPADPSTYETDPQNRWLARGPAYRLSAEQLRDAALASSGLMAFKLGGPSVKPYQPAGLWVESGTGKTYTQDHGERLYRRSLYTFWRRTAPPPSMLAFDATNREVCTARRERTTTPLQALVLLNDPQFVEAARVLAERLIHQFPDDVSERIATGFRQLTSRRPTSRELSVLDSLYNQQHERFTAATDEAVSFVSTGESPRDEQLDPADHAATAVVVSTLMNFDESMTKR